MIANNKTRAFLANCDSFAFAELPENVIDRAKESLLDYIGVTYAGVKALSEHESRLLSLLEGECGDGLTIGQKKGLALKDAVFLNGLNAHALDFDDGVNAGIIHLASPILSLLIPLAAKYQIKGQKFLSSVVSGYEVAWVLAMSVQPAHKLKGYHATGTCGMLGATLAAAYMLDFSENERFQAFSIACVSASGSLKVLEDGSELKPYNVAKASLSSLVSLQMAKSGFVGPEDAMSGDRGFLNLLAGSDKIRLKDPLIDGRYAIMRTYTKPYAACRYCHPAIEASIRLGEKLARDASSVKSIKVKTYELAVNKHDHIDIQGMSSAKMSIPYGVAIGYMFGKAGLNEYAMEYVSDQRVLELTSKVSVEADEVMTEAFPERTPATVQVSLVDGSMLEAYVDFPKGEPENPLSHEEVCSKFREMMAFGGKELNFANAVIDAVSAVESDLPQLLELLAEGE